MLDALLRSKFYTKCKSEIKLTKRRIEIIKRKRNAMLKFLRNDVADLLKNGLESNAFGRVEQLYVDQNLSTCYEFVEQSCMLILTHLSAIDKQRECPEECKEAISTLMFAAARFADLPELRELRSLFSERYGNLLELYVNKEFVKNMKAEIPSEEIKLLMLLDIKLEFNLEWDNKAMEQKLFKPPPFVPNSSQYPNVTKVEETKNKPINKQTEVTKKNETVGRNLPYKSRAEDEKREVKVNDGQRRGSPYWSNSSSSSGGSSSESTTSQDDSASEDGNERRKFNPITPIPFPYFKPESNQKSTSLDTTSRESKPKSDKIPNSLMSVGPPYVKSDLTKNVTTTPEATPRSMRIRRPLKPVAGAHRENEFTKPTPKISIGENRVEESKREFKLSAPIRVSSLPVENLGTSEGMEERKGGFKRAVTCHGDVELKHVHPKLPDYDDFVAQLAAFRAGS